MIDLLDNYYSRNILREYMRKNSNGIIENIIEITEIDNKIKVKYSGNRLSDDYDYIEFIDEKTIHILELIGWFYSQIEDKLKLD